MSPFAASPSLIERDDVAVMLRDTADELPAIQQLWPAFERQVGLRGRKMYGLVHRGTYTTCTPIHAGDDPEALGLTRGVLPGGRYLRGRLLGEPPELYTRIGPAVRHLKRRAAVDAGRPVVEFYRRHTEIELWVPAAG